LYKDQNSQTGRRRRRRRRSRRRKIFAVPRPGTTLSHLVKMLEIPKRVGGGEEDL
jgi:hypothetical protein